MKKNYLKGFLLGCLIVGSSAGFAQQKPTLKKITKTKDLKVTSTRTLNSINDVQAKNGKYQKQIDAIVASYDQEKLARLAEKFHDKAKADKDFAIAYAKEHNLIIREEDHNGSTIELQRILPDGTPIYYSTFNTDAAVSTRTNYLNTGGGLGLNLNGNGLTAHVWDGGHARVTHNEYDGTGGNNRVTLMDTAAEGGTQLNFHAAHVTGTVMASGQGGRPDSKGMAWQARVNGYMWNDDVAEATTAAGNGMLVSNHSYGFRSDLVPDQYFGAYINESRNWDVIMNNAPYYLMVVAAGNDGQQNAYNGAPLDGNTAYDKLTGHSTSKNNMVVANGLDANINGDGSLGSASRNAGSSEGPTDDYRIKPDIMGNGTQLLSTYQNANNAYNSITGTSMASPNVAGSLLLLQEHYNNLNGNFMRAATLKGLALHTADDVATNGPDATTGWGLMNSKFAAETITEASGGSGSAIISELTLNQGQTYQITVQSDGTNPLMASISWNDPAGTATGATNSNTPILVNDLDIRLNNGTTYTPWRLNNITTNGNGDNTVDPYERIDINGASGTYTLTVTHKGTLSGGSQNFSLIVTGVVVAASPEISFSSTSGNNIEGTGCSFTDVTIPVNIALAPSQNADVSFTVNGSSTATSGTDFQLMTNNVTFNSGSTTSQNMILRIFEDGFVESPDETVVIDFTVNANGGNASANTNADTLTYTITDDDNAPVATQTTTIASYDMEDLAGWGTYNEDGDAYNWFGASGPTLAGVIEGAFLASESGLTIFDNGDGATGNTNPGEYIITPAITIPATGTSVDFSFGIGSLGDGEHWAAYWFTEYTVAGINAATLLAEGDTTADTAGIATITGVTGIEGQTGYFTIRHFNSNGNTGALIFDTLSITTGVTTPIQTAVNNGTTNDQMMLSGSGTVYTSDSTSGDLILDITNNNTHDYGCITTSVARAGTGAQAYDGSVAPNLVMDKTFYINPTNTATNGNVSITFYFTEAEVAGWEAATGLNRNQLTVLRDDAGAITFAPDGNQTMATETSNLTIGTFGTDVTFTGTFTGLAGGYVFGPTDAFAATACFVPRVYLQGPYDTGSGMMTDGLRSGGHIPLTSPYGDGATTTNAVLNVTGNNAIVDWVWVELRDKNDNTSVLASTSALLQRDGDVVGAVDGTSTLKFSVPVDDYYISINHRNHLAFMTSTAQNIDASCKVVDLSIPTGTGGSIALHGTNAQAVSGGVRLMWAGDVDATGTSRFTGNANDSNEIRLFILSHPTNLLGLPSHVVTGYSIDDVNMDGEARFTGGSNDANEIKLIVLNHPGNILGLDTYVVLQQMP